MIESRLDPMLDGMGRRAGCRDMTVDDVARHFRYYATEGRGSSARSTLRLAREQLRSRSYLLSSPYSTLFCSFLSAAYLALLLHTFGHIPKDRMVGFSTGSCVLIIFVVRDCRQRRRRKGAKAQIIEIRRLALETLGIIVGRVGFVGEPLLQEERSTFNALRQADPEGWGRIAKALGEE